MKTRRFQKLAIWLITSFFWGVTISQLEAVTAETVFLHGSVPSVVYRLTPVSTLPASKQLHLAIGLPLRDPTGLREFLTELYNPASTNYHHFLTPAQFTERFGPTATDYATVGQFALSNNLIVTQTHENRLILDVTGSVADIQRAFRITIRTYHHPTEARDFYAPDTEPSVTVDLPISHISGLSDFERPQPKSHVRNNAKANATGSGPNGAYMGNDFRNAYLPGVTLTGTGQMVGLLQFDGFYSNDITAYEKSNSLPAVSLQTVLLDGYDGTPTSAGNVEVSLDIEMAIAMAPGLSHVVLFEAGPSGNLDDVLNAMVSSNQIKQFSCSWGVSGGPDTTADTIFQEMAAQGQSFFCASGDNDAFTIGSSSANGVNNPSLDDTPASSPYITQVGGTTLTTSGAGGTYVSEKAWNWNYDSSAGGYVGTSGGVSSYYTIPAWQTNVSMTANHGSTTYRNIPDVALTGDNIYVKYNNGSSATLGGTSCATPLWAALTALINQEAISFGKSPVGFLNPSIYALGIGGNYALTFHDVTTGSNCWSGGSPTNYFAVTGYDLCTGWGTPSGQALINALAGISGLTIGVVGGSASGNVGGPFTLTNNIYTLANVSSSPLSWQAINPVSWLSFSPTNGTLPVGAYSNVVASLTTTASNLNAGVYLANFGFSNITAGTLQSATFTLQIYQTRGIVTLENLSQTYNGSAVTVSATTSPTNLPVTLTYNGSSIAPTNAGAYIVVGTINSSNYYGGVTNTLIINQATPVINILPSASLITYGQTLASSTLSGGSASVPGVFVFTTPSIAPNAGVANASVVFTPTDTNDYSLINTSVNVTVNRALASVSLGNLNQVYNGFADGVIATTTPSNLAISVLYNGSSNVPTNAGSYTVVATVADPNYVGSATNTLIIQGLAPVITQQPVSQTIEAGNNTSLSVSVSPTGTSLYYQWYDNGIAIPGAQNSVLNFAPAATNNSGNYFVTVSNTISTVTSSVATLAVRPVGAPLIEIDSQPVVGGIVETGLATVSITGGYSGGYNFFTLDGSTPTASSSLYTGAFNVTSNCTVTAMSFSSDFSETALAQAVTVQIIPEYNVNTSVTGSGTVSLNPTTGPYPSNSVVILTATAGANYAFSTWQGAVTNTSNPLNLTVNTNLNIQALFTPTAYSLNLTTAGGGTVLANGQSAIGTYFATNSIVTLSAVTNVGWTFIGWQGDIANTNNPLTLNMSQAFNIQGVFGTTINTHAVGGGQIVLNSTNLIGYGSNVTASAVANNGNYLVLWSGAATGTNTPTTATVTNSNQTISALFATLPANKLNLSAVVVGDGVLNISPTEQYYNPGDVVTLTATPTDPNGDFYGWTGSAGGTNTTITVIMTTNLVVYANFVGTPSVNITPASLTILSGSNMVLTADASGIPPLKYQWQDSEGLINGATNIILEIDNIQPTNADNYSVIVNNQYGSVTSAVVTVTVVYPPSITLQPASQNIAAGADLNLSVLAAGTAPLNYQWYNSNGSITGATNSILDINPAQTNNGDNYFVMVANSYGSVTSSIANLFVYQPVSITSEPGSQLVTFGAPAEFVVGASGYPSPSSYQWTLNGTNLPGGISNSVTIKSVKLANTGSYQVAVGNGYSTATSSVAYLVMAPTITSPYSGTTAIWGRGTTLSVGAIGNGQLSYQWYWNGVPIDGATGPSLSFSSIQFTNAGLYNVVVSSPYGSVTNTPAQVVINPAGVSLGFYPGLTLNGVAGYNYIIQSSADLTNTNGWNTLTNLTLTQPVQLWVDTNVDASSPFNSKYFYRVLPGQ